MLFVVTGATFITPLLGPLTVELIPVTAVIAVFELLI
jgi:hypothetical protein